LPFDAKDDPFDMADNSEDGGISETFNKAPANRRLTLVSTSIYAKRTGGGAITSTTEANFPVAGPITLTFTQNIPAGSKVKAALGTSPLNNVNQSISHEVKYSDLRLQDDTDYYLALEIKYGTQTLFEIAGLNDYGTPNSLLLVESQNIWFKTTGPVSTSANAVQSGVASVTSSVFSLTSSGINGGTVTLGQPYCVQFDKLLNVTFAPASGEYDTNVPDLKIKFKKVTDSDGKVRVLKITPRYGRVLLAVTPVLLLSRY
jgi:hypothetical protein